MKNPLSSDLSQNLGLLVARLPLGAYFLVAGYAHLKTGVKAVASQYAANLPDWMPAEARGGYSTAVPFLELAVGAMLLLGLTTRLGALIGAVISFLLVAAAGFKFFPAESMTMLVFCGLSLTLFFMGGGKFTLDGFLFNKKKPAH